MLPSRDTRLGFADASYGFGRFFPKPELVTSFLRLDGAPGSTVGGISPSTPPTCDQSGRSRDKPLDSSGTLFAVDVLWSSVIIIGRDIPDPTIRPVWSINEK